jgi:hypothetical protein
LGGGVTVGNNSTQTCSSKESWAFRLVTSQGGDNKTSGKFYLGR